MGDDGSKAVSEGSQFPAATDPAILDPILDGLEASEESREVALELAGTVEGTMWIVGLPRRTVAATAVYVAGRATGERFTQTAVADHADVSTAVISRRKQSLLDAYREYAGDDISPRLCDLSSTDL